MWASSPSVRKYFGYLLRLNQKSYGLKNSQFEFLAKPYDKQCYFKIKSDIIELKPSNLATIRFHIDPTSFVKRRKFHGLHIEDMFKHS